MGMSPQEFWDMPPYLFAQKVDGYFQRENRSGIYFREMFALHANINRKEGSSPLTGYEVMPLNGEKKPRSARSRKISGWTMERIQSVTDRLNQQARDEDAAIAIALTELKEAGVEYPPTRQMSETPMDYVARLNSLKESKLQTPYANSIES